MGGGTAEERALSVGETVLWVGLPGGGACLTLIRAEPFLPPNIKPYEMAQLATVTFLLVLCLGVWYQVPSLLAAPVLTLIPVSRSLPEAFQARFKDSKWSWRGHWAAAAIFAASWILYEMLSLARYLYLVESPTASNQPSGSRRHALSREDADASHVGAELPSGW